MVISGGLASAQPSTPIPIDLPTATPTQLADTETPTRTPTSAGPALVQALTEGTNVRSGPDINNERVGQIGPTETYAVRGRRFQWLQIEFDDSPNGIGWVHQSVVTIIGDAEAIPDLSQQDVPAVDANFAAQQETLIAITSTPGAVETLNAEATANPAVTQAAQPLATGTPVVASPGFLPTFTYPPFTNTPLPIGELTEPREVAVGGSSVPPVAPILGLIGLGGLGIFVSLLRRG